METNTPRSNGPRRIPKWWIAVILFVIALTIAATLIIRHRKQFSGAIAFAPYGDYYATKTDFAEVEHKYPLSPKALMKITPETLKKYNQEQVDQIYARLTAGPIPDGPYDGDLFFPRGISGNQRLQEIAGGLKGVLAGIELQKMTILGRMLWKGKVFYRDQRVLRNRIEHLDLLESFSPIRNIKRHCGNCR